MPVFSAVITSKRARRGRSGESSRPLQDSSDSRRLRKKLDEATTSRRDWLEQEPKQPFSSSVGDIHTPFSTTMSTSQVTENGVCAHGVNLYQNPTINDTNTPNNSSPNSKSDIPSGVEKSFQRRRSFTSRKRDVDEILAKHPHKVPIIIERARKERSLKLLDKSKFLVPEELTMSQLTTIIRRRLQLSDTQAFYLIINRRTMVSASMTLAEVYRMDKDDDGFLYIVYASQEMFG